MVIKQSTDPTKVTNPIPDPELEAAIDQPKSTWDMTPEDVSEDADELAEVMGSKEGLRDVLNHEKTNDPNFDEPSEDGSVESEMTEELFRDRN